MGPAGCGVGPRGGVLPPYPRQVAVTSSCADGDQCPVARCWWLIAATQAPNVGDGRRDLQLAADDRAECSCQHNRFRTGRFCLSGGTSNTDKEPLICECSQIRGPFFCAPEGIRTPNLGRRADEGPRDRDPTAEALEFLHDKLGVVISRRLIDTPQSRRSDVDALVGNHIHCG